jgi:hypothetical protein
MGRTIRANPVLRHRAGRLVVDRGGETFGEMTRQRWWIAGALQWTLTGCGAPPEDVCGHIEDVVAQEVGPEAAQDAIEGCQFTWEMRRDTRGVLEYKELSDCVMESEDLRSLGQCK